MIDRFKKILMWAGMAVLIVIPLLLSFWIGLHRGIAKAQRDFKPDTLIVDHWDTLEVPKPVPVAVKQIDTMWFPVPVPVETPDTSETPDHVVIPREQAHYQDSTYSAWVSGYRPALDSIKVFRHNQTIYVDRVMEVKKKSHLGVGIQAGYGAYLTGNQVNLTPYVGVGVSYNIFSW